MRFSLLSCSLSSLSATRLQQGAGHVTSRTYSSRNREGIPTPSISEIKHYLYDPDRRLSRFTRIHPTLEALKCWSASWCCITMCMAMSGNVRRITCMHELRGSKIMLSLQLYRVMKVHVIFIHFMFLPRRSSSSAPIET